MESLVIKDSDLIFRFRLSFIIREVVNFSFLVSPTTVDSYYKIKYNDYELKSCIFVETDNLWTTGSNIHILNIDL